MGGGRTHKWGAVSYVSAVPGFEAKAVIQLIFSLICRYCETVIALRHNQYGRVN